MPDFARYSSVVRLLDRLVPYSASTSTGTRHGHRLLVAVLLAFALYLLALLAVSYCCLPLEPAGLKLVTVFSVTSIVGIVAALGIFRATRTREPALHCVFLAMMVAGSYISANLGGIYAPSNANLLLIPTLAILFIGIRSGIFWSSILVATWFALFIADRFGVVFPNVMLDKNAGMGIFMALTTGAVGITVVLMYYEWSNQKLTQLLSQEHRQYEHLANHDLLTGLPNRRFFIETVVRKVREAGGTGERFTILFFDLNNFKLANDLYDHQFGDEVLAQTARRLLDNTREGDTVARWGGDEFAMLLSTVSETATVVDAIKRIKAALEAPLMIRDAEYQLGVSTGFAVFPRDGRNLDSLMAAADESMYQQKGGRIEPGCGDPAVRSS